ncbi:MAG TPA: monovalent cation/H(+) antiporter subunit G [Candidatus Ruania gallistercoris]|uniref:Monovalent cation/H(+) antiporter subunit G n=1 Tax=Candidatus Ruania gallistercoris TaxID=2838746 RepID=A0A9D2EGS3_9MICO|nr:monovalent cation/H(+) antiporter subunit G [Candidatus Ruania gallistercoris]
MSATEILAAVLLICGSALTFIAAVGVARFPDLLSRMHAATKPQVLGLMLMMGGLAVSLASSQVTWKLTLVVAFQLITAPVSAHMVGRAGYRTHKVDSEQLATDELTEDLHRARAEAENEG